MGMRGASSAGVFSGSDIGDGSVPHAVIAAPTATATERTPAAARRNLNVSADKFTSLFSERRRLGWKVGPVYQSGPLTDGRRFCAPWRLDLDSSMGWGTGA